jgi:hypothetical protein
MQNHDHDDEMLRKLLRLKRYETPGDHYFENFLEQYHKRRDERQRSAAEAGVISRVREWFDDLAPQPLGSGAWTAVSGAAAAVLVFAFLVFTNPRPQGSPAVLAVPEAPEAGQTVAPEERGPLQDPTALGGNPVIIPSQAAAPVEFSTELPVLYSDVISPVQYSTKPSRDRLQERQVVVPVIIRSPMSARDAFDLLSPDYLHPDPEDASQIPTVLDDTQVPNAASN